MFKIFVSYSSKDLHEVQTLQSSLKGTEIEVFASDEAIAPGEKFQTRLSKELTECDLFVLVWSEHAKDSEWVQQEIGKAHELSKPILPLLFAETPMLPGFIRDLNFIDCRKEKSSAMDHAREFILSEYNKKRQRIEAAQKKKKADEEAKALFVLGGFVFWLFTR